MVYSEDEIDGEPGVRIDAGVETVRARRSFSEGYSQLS